MTTHEAHATWRQPLRRFQQARTARAGLQEAVGLENRRIFILPTRLGLGFACLLLVMLAGAINYNNSLVFGLTFLLAGLGTLAMLHTYRNLAGLNLRLIDTEPGFAGSTIGFLLQLSASQPRPDIQLYQNESLALVQVPGPEACTTWLRLPGRQRGRQALGVITVATRFPLGLFHCWSRIDFHASVLVYPRPAGSHRPLPISSRHPSQAGDQGRGHDDFRGFRVYHPGDSPRHLNWKALAREQGPLTKEFGGDRVEERWLDWDQLSDPDPEQRLSQLCRWVLDADAAGVHYGLRLPDREIPLARGAAHRLRCLAALAEYRV